MLCFFITVFTLDQRILEPPSRPIQKQTPVYGYFLPLFRICLSFLTPLHGHHKHYTNNIKLIKREGSYYNLISWLYLQPSYKMLMMTNLTNQCCVVSWSWISEYVSMANLSLLCSIELIGICSISVNDISKIFIASL